MNISKNSSFPSFGRLRINWLSAKRESSPSKELPRDAGDKAKRHVREKRWIPACAGMTAFEFLEAP
jgi:hypothetical protein